MDTSTTSTATLSGSITSNTTRATSTTTTGNSSGTSAFKLGTEPESGPEPEPEPESHPERESGPEPQREREREQGITRLDPEREDAILRATLDVLAKTGYDGLRLDTVAARAKASKATLYRHWPGKAELVVSAVKCYKQADLVTDTDTGSLRGDVLATLRCIADMMTGPTGQIMAGLMVAMQRDSELAATVRASMLEDKQHVNQNMIDRAIDRGELPADTDPQIFPEIAPAVLFSRIFIQGRPADEAYLIHLTDEILVPLMTRH